MVSVMSYYEPVDGTTQRPGAWWCLHSDHNPCRFWSLEPEYEWDEIKCRPKKTGQYFWHVMREGTPDIGGAIHITVEDSGPRTPCNDDVGPQMIHVDSLSPPAVRRKGGGQLL